MAKPEAPVAGSVPPPAPEAPGAATAPRSVALPIAITLAVVFAVTAVFLAIVATSLKSDKDELAAGGDQEELIAAAAQFTQAFVDRDTTVESLRDDVVALSTGAFAEQFTDGIDTVVELDEAVGLAETRATISDVFVTASDGPSAQAIVIYDSVSAFTDGRVVENQNQYMVLRLLDVDGEWLVDNANDLLRVLANAGGAVGAGTTSSTPSG